MPSTLFNTDVSGRNFVDDKQKLPSNQIPSLQSNTNFTGKYPKWIGRKFDPNGMVLVFAGNTVLGRIQPRSREYQVLSEIHQELSRSEFGVQFALLPPSSYHVTLMEGVCDTVRNPGCWPRDLSTQACLADCNQSFDTKLRSAPQSLIAPFRMRIDGWRHLENGISLRAIPADVNEEHRLRSLREYLAETLQLRHPNHDNYEFHISLTYSLRYFTGEEEGRITALLQKVGSKLPEFIELGPPELCTFNDMFAYRHLCFVGVQPSSA